MNRDLEKRMLLLPIAWAAFGLAMPYGLRYLLGPIVNVIPIVPNDKPIGGAVFPVLFYSAAMVLVVLSVSFYSVGVWSLSLSRRKDQADLTALIAVLVGGFLLWYTPFGFALVIGALIYLLAVNIE